MNSTDYNELSESTKKELEEKFNLKEVEVKDLQDHIDKITFFERRKKMFDVIKK